MTRYPIATLAALALLVAALPAEAQSYPHMRYNMVRQKQIHNAMDAWEPVIDMLNYHDVRSLEFDIHNGKSFLGSLDGDWWLYHTTWGDSEFTQHSAETLSDALKEVQTFHWMNPQHEAITIYIDQHDDFEVGRSATDLDALINRFFHYDPLLANSEVFTPYHLYYSGSPSVLPVPGSGLCPCNTLQSCVDGTYSTTTYPSCQWPLLQTLRGKIIFVITGGTKQACEYLANDTSGIYDACDDPADDCDICSKVGGGWAERRAFATADHTYVNTGSYSKTANPYGYNRFGWEVFFNEAAGDVGNVWTPYCTLWPNDCNKSMGQIVDQKHLINRSYQSDDDTTWNVQKNNKVHIIGTDKVNESADSWSATRNAHGFPFNCSHTPGEACISEVEARGSPMVNLTVGTADFDSGDTVDSIAFVEKLDPTDKDWEIHVTTANSHTEDWAKGCLMARHHRGIGAAYFAVCRTADNHRVQVQYRIADGDGAYASGYDDSIDVDEQLWPTLQSVTLGSSLDLVGVYAESTSFIKIRSFNGSTILQAFASRDSFTWVPIGPVVPFPYPLGYKGIAATSHGASSVLWRFQQHRIGGAFANVLDGTWRYWLIGSPGSVPGTCTNGSCSFTSTPADAYLLTPRSGWGT